MRIFRIIQLTAALISSGAFVAHAEFVETWSTGGDVGDWIGAGGAALTTNPGNGGNPGGYLRAERTNGFAWVSNARTTPELNGNLFAQHGDDIILTADYALLSPDDFVGGFFARFYSDAGTGDWRAEIPAPGDKQVMTDGWITYTIPLNKNWTDEEAVAAGWNDNGASASFEEHFSALITTGNNDIASFDLHDEGATGSVQGYDNFGYLTNPGTEDPPTVFTWDLSGMGNWLASSSWDPGGGPPNSASHTAILSNALTSSSTITVDSPVTVNRIEFNNTIETYAVAGLGVVNLAATTSGTAVNPSISVAGNHQFQAAVSLHEPTSVSIADSGASLEFINRLNLNGQTLTKTGDGTLLVNSSFDLSGGTIVNTNGVIAGGGTVGGSLENPGGTVAPGNSPGILSVSGNYTQGGGGTLEIEIMGTNPGEGGHDQLNVTGSASLNGTLDIQTDAGFTPGVGAMPGMIGDKFVIITAGSVSGEFSTVNGRHTGGGKFYKVGYNPTNVSLGAFQALGGDTEGDLDVDITDFNTLAGNFGNTGVEWTDADFDANDVIDITDFNTLAANFGPYGGPGDGPGQVPEPSAILLLGLGLVPLSWLFRRKTQA